MGQLDYRVKSTAARSLPTWTAFFKPIPSGGNSSQIGYRRLVHAIKLDQSTSLSSPGQLPLYTKHPWVSDRTRQARYNIFSSHHRLAHLGIALGNDVVDLVQHIRTRGRNQGSRRTRWGPRHKRTDARCALSTRATSRTTLQLRGIGGNGPALGHIIRGVMKWLYVTHGTIYPLTPCRTHVRCVWDGWRYHYPSFYWSSFSMISIGCPASKAISSPKLHRAYTGSGFRMG